MGKIYIKGGKYIYIIGEKNSTFSMSQLGLYKH